MGGCNRPTHRFGLCGKHRKWVEKGYMDLELRMLKPFPIQSRSYSGCKVDGCERKHRRNGFCSRHDDQFKRGSIDASGVRLVPERIYPEGTTCKVCSGGGRIVLGFCHKHYTQHKRGRLTADGRPGRGLRMVKVRCGSCKIEVRLLKKPVGDYFCNQMCREDHEKALARKAARAQIVVAPRPKPLPMIKKKCRLSGCKSLGYAKSLCIKHYSRQKNGHPLTDEAFFTNKGHTCSVEGCERSADCRGMCSTHYSQMQRNGVVKPIKPIGSPPIQVLASDLVPAHPILQEQTTGSP